MVFLWRLSVKANHACYKKSLTVVHRKILFHKDRSSSIKTHIYPMQ